MLHCQQVSSPCSLLLGSAERRHGPGTILDQAFVEEGLTHGVDGPAVGDHPKAVLEDTSCVEEGQGDAHDLLEPVLDPPQP